MDNLKEHLQHHKNEFDDLKLSSKSDDLFKNKLKNELHPPKKGALVYWNYISVAASIVLVLSVFFWNQNSNELKETSAVLGYLTDDSAGKRLEGVYQLNENFIEEDAHIIDVLLDILYNDENGNVKLATIDALLKFPKNEKIRTHLIRALETEKLPLVQIKIIKSLSFLRENRAQKSLEKIINNEQTFPIVKSNATLAMNQLKQ